MRPLFPGAGNLLCRIIPGAGVLLFLVFAPPGIHAQPLGTDLTDPVVLQPEIPLDLPPDVGRGKVPAPLVDDVLYAAIVGENFLFQVAPKKKRRPRVAASQGVAETWSPEDGSRRKGRKSFAAVFLRLHTCLCLSRPPPAASYRA